MDKKDFVLQISRKLILGTTPIKDSLLELFLSKPNQQKQIIQLVSSGKEE